MKNCLVIGNNIKKYRSNQGITQADFADYLGINREEVSYYENGKRSVPSKIITKAAELFGVEEYDLYEEDKSSSALNIAFAFRASELKSDDLKTIAKFKKIAMNYLKMKKALS